MLPASISLAVLQHPYKNRVSARSCFASLSSCCGEVRGRSLEHHIHGSEQKDRHMDPRLLPPVAPASFLCSHGCLIQAASSHLSHQSVITVSHRHVHSQPVLDKALIETVFLGDLWQIDKLTFKSNHHWQLPLHSCSWSLGSVSFSLLSVYGVFLSVPCLNLKCTNVQNVL